MHHKKFRVAAVLMLVLTLVFLTACGKSRTPKETLIDAYMKSADLNSANFKTTIELSLDLPNATDPDVAMFAGLLSQTKLSMEGAVQSKPIRIAADMSLDMGGMGFTAEIYMDEEKLAFYMPFLSQMMGIPADNYVFFELDAVYGTQAGFDKNPLSEEGQAEMLALGKELSQSFLNAIEEGLITNNGDQTIRVGGQDIKVTEIQTSITEENLPALLEAVFSMFETEALRELIIQQAQVTNPEITEELFQEELAEAKEIILTELDDITFHTFQIDMKIYLDEKDNTVKEVVDVVLDAEFEGERIYFGVKADTETWNHNQSLNIELPELNEDNSFDITQFVTPQY